MADGETIITISMTSKQALAVINRLIDRQLQDKRNMRGYTASYRESIVDIDDVLMLIREELAKYPQDMQSIMNRAFEP